MVAAALLAVLAATPRQVEEKGYRYVAAEFERAGRAAPQLDPVLSQAARRLANDALTTGADQAADLLTVTQEVSDAGGFDPTPRAVVVRATPAQYALETFVRRHDYNEEPATHVGVGVAMGGERAVVVALLADRKATLSPFPRRLERTGEVKALCGELRGALRHAEVFVTRPQGDVDRIAVAKDAGPRFCANVAFDAQGRHSVEVIGEAARGPEVAAIFFVDVGLPPGAERAARILEPRSAGEAKAALLVRINGLREAHGLPRLVLDDRLSEVAQAHSDRMAREHFFAHVSPDGTDLRGRLVNSGYRYLRAGENLGLAAGPLAAHFAIEQSPGHRANLLEPDFTVLGLGIAVEDTGTRRQVIVTEVLARPQQLPRDPVGVAYRAIDDRRAAHKLPPLSRNPVLEAIALEHARRALKLDQPRLSLPGAQVHERVFEAMKDVKSAAVDFFVAEDPASLPDSDSLEDRRNDTVGVGAVRGDSPTYGPEKYWVVVIYAAKR